MNTINRLAFLNTVKHFLFVFFICWFSFAPSKTAHATEASAFNTLNLNPLVQIFGLPSLNNRLIGAKGTAEFDVELQVANYSSRSTPPNEAIKLDGETWRTTFNAAYVITDRSQISLSIPSIRHSKGHLDSLIYDWHDFFDMPQGGRTKDTNDEIDMRYIRNNETVVSLRSTTSGIGDIRIKYGYSLPVYERELVLQTELKLPTGDLEKLTGSEGTDLSVGFMLNDSLSLQEHNVSFWYGAATTYIEDAKGRQSPQSQSDLSDEQNNIVFSGRTGIAWRANDSITLKTQLDSHSAVYDSDTDELGDPALMITLGGDIHFSPRYRLEISAVEDIITTTSPDIIFTTKFTVRLE